MRNYNALRREAALTAARDLIEITAGTDRITKIKRIEVTQEGGVSSDNLELIIARATGSGSGGGTVTPAPLDIDHIAFSGTVEGGNTTAATGLTNLDRVGFNSIVGFLWQADDDEEIEIEGSDIFVVRLNTAPTDGDWLCKVTLKE